MFTESSRGRKVLKSCASFVGHDFHHKTRSCDFFINIIRKHFDIKRFSFDPDGPDNLDYGALSRAQCDINIFWQAESVAARLLPLLRGRMVLVPMYDGAVQRDPRFWQLFPQALFISFSSALHTILQGAGCSSILVQYWPKPIGRQWDPKAPLSGFFWERRPGEGHDARRIISLAKALGLSWLHIHLAADFAGDPDRRRSFLERLARTEAPSLRVTFSTWFERREDLEATARQHAIYFAPRSVEGIGMSFLEAMAAGQIVIGPDAPTLDEYLSDGRTGFLLRSAKAPGFSLPGRQGLVAMSDAVLSSVTRGRRRWEEDKERMLKAILRGYPCHDTDQGAAFTRMVRMLAGERK